MSDVREFIAAQAQQETDKSAQVRQAKEAMAGPMPLIADAPDCSVLLPRGLWDRSGYKRMVTVRELTGIDEEALAKTKDNLDFYDLVIALGVESIDDMALAVRPTAERQALLRSLLLGERDQLFLAIVRATFGDKREIGIRCTACQTDQDMTLYISKDFKAKEVDDVAAATFTYLASKGEVQYRLVTGDDQMEAMARRNSTTAEQNTIILSRVITKVNGQMIVDPMAFVRQLSIRNRAAILTALTEKQPSVDLTVRTNCAACSAEQTIALDWGTLFRP